jgi:hypothetical protein
VLLLFLFFVSDTCINLGDGFPPTETASRGVSAGDCIAVPAALLLSDSPAACCCCSWPAAAPAETLAALLLVLFGL